MANNTGRACRYTVFARAAGWMDIKKIKHIRLNLTCIIKDKLQ